MTTPLKIHVWDFANPRPGAVQTGPFLGEWNGMPLLFSLFAIILHHRTFFLIKLSISSWDIAD